MLKVALVVVSALLCSAAAAKDTGLIFVSNEKTNNIIVIDPASYKVVKDIKVARRPRDMHFNADHSRLYVACGDDDVIDILDVAKLQVVGKLKTGPSPEAFAIDEKRGRIYVSDEEGSSLAVIDMEQDAIVQEVPTGAEPEGVLVGEDGKTVYVTSEAGDLVHAIDADTGKIVRDVVVGLRPRRLAATPDGKDLWVTAELAGEVDIIDRGKFVVTGNIAFLPPGMRKTDVTPVGLAMTRDGKTAYVTLGHAAHVAVVDVPARKVLGYILVGKTVVGRYALARRDRRFTSPTASATTSPSSTPRAARRKSRCRSAAFPMGSWSMISAVRWALALCFSPARSATAAAQDAATAPPRQQVRSALSRSKTIRATSRSAPTSASSSRPANIRSPAPRSASTRRRRSRACCRSISRSNASPRNRRPTWRRPCLRRSMAGTHFFLIDAPADAFKPLAAAMHGRDALFQRLRAGRCAAPRPVRAGVRPRLSEPRAAHGRPRAVRRVAQMARPPGLRRPLARRRRDGSGVRAFGAKIRRPHRRRPAFQARHRPARARAKRSGAAERHQPRFRRRSSSPTTPSILPARCPTTWRARVRSSAASILSRWRGTGPGSATARRKSIRASSKKSGGRHMEGARLGGLDRGQDDRAIGAAHAVRPISPSSAPSFSATAVSTATKVWP